MTTPTRSSVGRGRHGPPHLRAGLGVGEALRLLAVVDLLLPDDPRPRALAEAVRRGGFEE